MVWAPFIPIWEKWIPFAAALLAVVFAPALPNLHARLATRRHEIALLSLLMDMDAAGRALPMPETAPALPAHAPESRDAREAEATTDATREAPSALAEEP